MEWANPRTYDKATPTTRWLQDLAIYHVYGVANAIYGEGEWEHGFAGWRSYMNILFLSI
jgi:hypothetical protein